MPDPLTEHLKLGDLRPRLDKARGGLISRPAMIRALTAWALDQVEAGRIDISRLRDPLFDQPTA
jgi:hypothetical protein